MNIDSHAHYNHAVYKKPFWYLSYGRDVLLPKLLRRTRNTTLILPAVIEKIAQIKGMTPETVEQATAENAILLFQLLIEKPMK